MKHVDSSIGHLIVISMFILASFPLVLAESTGDVGITVRISLDKQEYLLDEPLWIWIEAENTTKDEVFAVSIDPVYGNIYFHLVSSKGDSVFGACVRGMFGECPTFDPGQSDVYCVNLVGPVCTYGMEMQNALHGRAIPEGRYTLQAELRIYPHPKSHKEGFQVYSKKVSFRVEEPSGNEIEAWQRLVRGHRRLYRERETDEGIEMLWGIVEQYPNSVYRDVAYDHASFHFHDRAATLEFLDKNPNSGFVSKAIFAATPKTGRPAERKEFLEHIIKTYPNTKAAVYAENRLDKWRRGKIWVDEPIE